MAKIKWSAIGITNASGKSGGTVFSFNRYGAYARRWAKPVNAQTSAQQAMRTIWGSVSQAWGTILTQAERDIWNEEAKTVNVSDGFGDTRNMTGFTYFMRVNFNRLHGMNGLNLISLPLPKVIIPSISNVVNDVQAGQIDFDIQLNNAAPSTQYSVTIASVIVPAGQGLSYGSVKNKFETFARILTTSDPLGRASVNIVSSATLDQLPAGTTVFIQAHVHNASGQKSAPYNFEFTVTP